MVGDGVGLWVIVPFLLLVIDNLVLNSEDLVVVLPSGGQNLVDVLISSGLGVEIEAVLWLEGGGMWLSMGVSIESIWVSSALLNLEIESDIRVEWDWLSSEWGKGISSSPSIV